jgi:CheY-like chemotaxis protein
MSVLEVGHARQLRRLDCGRSYAEIDGLELYRRAKQDRADLPIIFISGRNEEHARQFAIQVAAAFFDKPFQADDILRAVHAALILDGAEGQA